MDSNTTILLVAVIGIGFFLLTQNQPGSQFQQGPQGPVQAGPGPASGTISDIEQAANAIVRTTENAVGAGIRIRNQIEGRT